MPARSGSFFPYLVAGAAGGVLTLGGLGALGLLGDNRGNEVLTTRIATLEQSIKAASAQDVASKIAATESRIAKVEETAKTAVSAQAQLAADTKAIDGKITSQVPAAQATADRLAKLEEQLRTLGDAANTDPQRGRIPALAQITTKIGELDTALTTRTTSLKTEVSQDVEKRLAKMSETHEADRARLSQRAQSIEQTLKSVSDDTTALRQSVDTIKTDVETRFKSAAKPADIAAAVEPVTSKIVALEKNVATVVRSEADRNVTAGNVLLSIELASLKRALDRGGKYADELAAVKRAGSGKLNLAVLESAQNTGVPSLAQLLTEFRTLAYKMLDAEAEPADASVLDRMLSGAKSVVRVRKVDHAAGDKSTEAVIGRMETAVKEGRLGDVIDESKQLPEKARTPADAWLKKISARFAIDKSLAELETGLKSALAGAPEAKKGTN